jgi:hypothetical protein
MAASGVNVPQASFGHSSKKGKDDTKRRRAFSIQDLPAGCRDDDQWSQSFLPSYFAFVAVQRDVWGFSGKRAVDAMQTIWNAIYDGNIPYKIRVSDCPVYSVVRTPPCKGGENAYVSVGPTAPQRLVAWCHWLCGT